MAHQRLGNWGEAVKDAQQAVQLKPDWEKGGGACAHAWEAYASVPLGKQGTLGHLLCRRRPAQQPSARSPRRHVR